MNISIFTRTSWSEFPRLRHQVALLLAGHGHTVTFFEKPDGNFSDARKISERLTVVPMPEIIHHQLRPFRFISDAANFFPKRLMRSLFQQTQYPDAILNFNYYFYFLKKTFPQIPVITIINDDFTAQGKFWMKNSIASQVKDTCASSDAVLTVSYPLHRKLTEYNPETFLFFPWAEKKYSSPLKTPGRNVVLYFGHINHRLDFELMNEIASAGIPFRLIGPVQRTVNRQALNRFLRHSNVTLLPPSPFSETYLDDVCCSVLPYDLNLESVNACSVSNRSFNLLSYGIPLIAPLLPGGIKFSDDVISYSRKEEFRERINYFRNNFYNVQEKIEAALTGNYPGDRYGFLETLLARISEKKNKPFLNTAEQRKKMFNEKTS